MKLYLTCAINSQHLQDVRFEILSESNIADSPLLSRFLPDYFGSSLIHRLFRLSFRRALVSLFLNWPSSDLLQDESGSINGMALNIH